MGKNSWKESDLLLKGRNLKGEFAESVIPKKAQPIKKKAGRKSFEENTELIIKDTNVYQSINIAPLSVNKAWQGKRFKTKEYSKYEERVLKELKDVKLPIPPFKLIIEYGFSNKASDIDNPTKLILDILQKKYKFNDKDIYELNLRKKIVMKGEDYFTFLLKTLK